MRVRHLVLILGDQLDGESSAFDGFDQDQDEVLQMEVSEETICIPQHKRRLGEAILFHSHLSGPLNPHLLRPREVVDAAIANPSGASLNSVEGFVRQIIGWREFVRGVYWRFMPEYAERNALGADLPMPRFY